MSSMMGLSFLLVASLGPIYATPQTIGWPTAYSKAMTALGELTNQDKVNIVTGLGWQQGPCVGNTGAVSSIGYPSLCLQDGPLGVRYKQQVTAFPAGIMAASTWDTNLIYARGNALGTESKASGVNVQLGPVAGPMGKIPDGGRNWEGFSPDPYLNGIAMSNTVNGIQDAGVQACAKHFIGNEQELNRETMSANIDDRTLHELYLWPFIDAVEANVAAVMCSYNQLNTTWSCENDQTMNGILKGELGFQGYVMSDWNAQHTLGAANAGLDMSMPGSDFSNQNVLWGSNLLNAVNNGTVPQSRLDNMAQRILAAWYLLAQDSGYPSVNWSSWNGGSGGPNVQGTHQTVVRDIAGDGIVLLKNTNNALPLTKPSSVALIGQDAIVNPAGANACSDRGCDIGTLAMGWGSGTCEFPYLTAPYDAINAQATTDGTKITLSNTDDPTLGAAAASDASAALVFINADSGEGYITVEGNAGDRNNLDPWHDGNALVSAVATNNPNTIVVIHSVGPLILESILAEPNVTAVVWVGIPGQESGNGLVDILYGAKSPSGKLPYTIAQQATDYDTAVALGNDDYPEGLYIDYRHFDQADIDPRYEFGFGLSYTTFNYSDFSATYTDKTPASPTNLLDTVATVAATVTNAGPVAGAEVAQLYIGLPDGAPPSPPKQLRGFQKASLAPGAAGPVTFKVRRRDLAYWDVGAQAWVVPEGAFAVYVGASSRDVRWQGTM